MLGRHAPDRPGDGVEFSFFWGRSRQAQDTRVRELLASGLDPTLVALICSRGPLAVRGALAAGR
jgi:hypothetical protein